MISQTRHSVQVLYEDNHLLVLSKPVGMPTVPDSSKDFSLLEWGKAYLKESRNKPGNVFLGVVHRLDRPVSGVICFATTSKAASRLSDQLRNKKIEKTYLAVVHGAPPSEAELIHWISKDRRKNIVKLYAKNPGGHLKAKKAKTHLKLLKTIESLSLVELVPETGRPHQLRAQCAKIGCPIVGDLKYGAPEPLPNRSIALHALKLTLQHPTKKNTMTFIAEPPDFPPWNMLGAIHDPGFSL